MHPGCPGVRSTFLQPYHPPQRRQQQMKSSTLALSALLATSLPAFAVGIAEPAGISPQLRAPEGETPAFVLKAAGVQIYNCKASADGYEYKWTFVAPEAALSENGSLVGHHGAGPVWEDPPSDKSGIEGHRESRSRTAAQATSRGCKALPATSKRKALTASRRRDERAARRHTRRRRAGGRMRCITRRAGSESAVHGGLLLLQALLTATCAHPTNGMSAGTSRR